MGYLFDGSTDSLQRTANIPDQAAFSASGWAYRIGDQNLVTNVFVLWDTGLTVGVSLCFDTDGTSLAIHSSLVETKAFGTTPGANTWFFWALTGNASTINGYWALPSDTSLVNESVGQTIGMTENEMEWGGSWTSGTWFSGRLAALKVWDAELTSAELRRERLFYTPQRTANLNLWCPGFEASTTDFGPNKRNLTAGGSVTTAPGPPILWAPSLVNMPPKVVVAAGHPAMRRFGGIRHGREYRITGVGVY